MPVGSPEATEPLAAFILSADFRAKFTDADKYLALLDREVDRKALKQLLREEYGVGLSGEVYDAPCHVQPVFAAYSEGEFPVAADICARHVCLPVYATMSDEDARYVLASLAAASRHLLKG